ncbi:MAG: hypothetical protein LBE50_04415, partial [Gallionellaceae bacterium]|nr:hypothetical protein [Gallionellaceae bacterium]
MMADEAHIGCPLIIRRFSQSILSNIPIAMQFTTSINHVFKWFLGGISDKSLNSYYYFLKHTRVPWNKFLKITIGLVMSLMPEELAGLPIFLAIDDTLQEKFGTHFECYQTMFDHAKHNGTNYLKGH